MDQQTEYQLKYLAVLLFLLFYAILSPYLQHKHFPLHRSAVAIIIGILVGFFIFISAPDAYNQLVKINQTIIFSVLLPPMIFLQGFNFKKNAFLKNFKYIAVFGILGTFLSFAIISGLVQAANQLNLIRDIKDITNIRTLSIWQVLLLSACMCSIDTVASEEAVSEKKYKKLHSIVVGEDIFKDSITIVLFRAILHLQENEKPSQFVFYWYTAFQIILKFIQLIVCSSLIGILMAIITTFLFKKLRFLLHDDGITQTTVMFLLGISTYLLTQLATFSGLISILCYGVLLNRLNIYNLSNGGRQNSNITFSSISIICEGLLFLIMGMMVWQVKWDKQSTEEEMSHSWTFVLIVIAILLLSRAINIYLLSFIFQKCNKKFKMNKDQLKVLFVSGLVKGATPFALFTSVEEGGSQYSRNQGLILKSTIIIIVIITSVFLNSFIEKIYHKPLKNLNQEAKEYLLRKSQKVKFIEVRKQRLRKIEDKMKPYLIYKYDERKEEIELHKQSVKSKQIQQALSEFEEDFILNEKEDQQSQSFTN